MPLPDHWDDLQAVQVGGWLIHGKGRMAGRFVLDDLRDVEAPEALQMESFVVAARERIATNFRIEDTITQTIALYRSLVSE